MMNSPHAAFQHPVLTRRTAIQAGCLGLLGLGMNHVAALRALGGPGQAAPPKTVLYIFLSGGLSQIDSFDLKPDAPESIRGEFKPIATKTPGIRICEHLPMLAARSDKWALLRSLTHPSNDHSAGHAIMLTGRSTQAPGFNPNAPRSSDWPSIAAIAGAATRPRNNLPPAAILPDRLVHTTGRVIPGPYAGLMGPQRDPWLIDASGFDSRAYGAYPQYEFDHQQRAFEPKRKSFQIPNLSLPEELGMNRFSSRVSLLRSLDQQRAELETEAALGRFDRFHEGAVALLAEPKVRRAFDVAKADPKVLERYGDNAFGWSLLMARRLVEAGVNLVQVNLGNNETWDTHGNAFPHLKDKLFPPTDRALSALLDDLAESGQLDSTLIVMAGEFGRTPKITTLPQHYKLPGRDHWGAVQTVFFAGGGVRGGTVLGSSDKIGGHPATDPRTPENVAATIYQALGIPSSDMWHDSQQRPHHIYYGEPIAGLM